MALLNKLKCAFGFGSNDDDEIIADDPDASKGVSVAKDAVNNAYTVPQPKIEINLDEDEALSAIFEHVVSTFNKSLPDFLSKSVDEQAERKYLYDSLSSDLKQYLSSIAERTQQQCQDSWSADKERLQENVRELETKARNIEEKREELSQKQLSVERQKRALSDRVHDLEKQLMTYEAEREQFQLENKSLVNKLKVASVNEKDIDAMRDEITRLQEELNEARKKNLMPKEDGSSEAVVDRSEEIKALEDKVKFLEAELESAKTAEHRSSDLEGKIAELESKLNEANEKETRANEELELLKSKVDDADAVMKEMSEIENQIVQFEQIKEKKDARINDLTKELEEAKNQVSMLTESLKNSKNERTNSERALSEEIERLKKELEEAQKAKSVEQKQSERRPRSVGGSMSRNRVEQNSSHIDDILSDTDWLVSPSSLKSNKNAQSNNANHNNNNQHRQDKNDAQMTLF